MVHRDRDPYFRDGRIWYRYHNQTHSVIVPFFWDLPQEGIKSQILKLDFHIEKGLDFLHLVLEAYVRTGVRDYNLFYLTVMAQIHTPSLIPYFEEYFRACGSNAEWMISKLESRTTPIVEIPTQFDPKAKADDPPEQFTDFIAIPTDELTMNAQVSDRIRYLCALFFPKA